VHVIDITEGNKQYKATKNIQPTQVYGKKLIFSSYVNEIRRQ